MKIVPWKFSFSNLTVILSITAQFEKVFIFLE